MAGLVTAASAAWPRVSLGADTGAWTKLAGGSLNDAPVQVPSSVLLLTFAILMLGSLLLIRAGAPRRGSAAPTGGAGRFARSEESRVT